MDQPLAEGAPTLNHTAAWEARIPMVAEERSLVLAGHMAFRMMAHMGWKLVLVEHKGWPLVLVPARRKDSELEVAQGLAAQTD